ncbi:hypothetical protein LTR53_005508 [Teratosphaeriaceae sp. CCFEE 6253]|nr:hypothetical protein LTR53_005508 [Teratosphaeriaceae sp. CCFEE 6253]
MFLGHFTSLIASPLALSVVASSLLLSYAVYNRYGRGLNHIPGPFTASCTNFWRLFLTWRRRPETTHIALHQKYGNVVRLGPNAVSVADPQAIKTLYGLHAGFIKSDFYPVQQTIAKGRSLHSLFNTTDEVFHAKLRRAVSNAYAMSTLVQFEPLVDSTTVAFLKQLERRYADRPEHDEAGVCDFGTWLQWYAFDVIGEMTYSRRLGFVDEGEDVDGIIQSLETLLDYVSVVGQVPILDRLLLKNPLRLWLSKIGVLGTNSSVVNFARTRIAERDAKKSAFPADAASDLSSGNEPQARDFLSRFQEAHSKDPVTIPPERVLALTVANMFAGSDTTAITLRAVFYHLLRNPAALQRLMLELEADDSQLFRAGSVKWSDVRDLPYLGAVIKEALRCHPAVGLTLERIVPPAGITVCDRFIPGGTVVGCSAWVLHRNEQIFGADADRFRPERWLDVPAKQRADMNSFLFSFGAGARTCIGKNISLLVSFQGTKALCRGLR